MSSVRRPHGRLLQIRGPAAPKLLSPMLLCVRGTAQMLSEELWIWGLNCKCTDTTMTQDRKTNVSLRNKFSTRKSLR